jgi:hypothetical protein
MPVIVPGKALALTQATPKRALPNLSFRLIKLVNKNSETTLNSLGNRPT